MSNIKLYLENNSNYNLKEQQSQAYGAPYVRPCALDKFLDQHNVGYSQVEFEDTDHNTWYPINIYFFDFECDYFSYIRKEVLDRVRQKRLRILFIYSEPDFFGMRTRIDKLAKEYGIAQDLVFILSGNSRASNEKKMSYLQYHEFLFEIQNTVIPQPTVFDRKPKKYTCLNRIHKQYRKEFVYNLWKDGLTNDAYVSYGNVENTESVKDIEIVNDLMIDAANIKNLTPLGFVTEEFENILPLRVDDFDTDFHNNHAMTVDYLFTDSYWNIVMETYLDVFGGVFLTEKTFKPIKYGQPFVILGTTNSLALLKEQGYKTYGSWIDESYDQEYDIRQRWLAVLEITRKIASMSLEKLHNQHVEMTSTILHNQAWFKRNKKQELEQSLKKLL